MLVCTTLFSGFFLLPPSFHIFFPLAFPSPSQSFLKIFVSDSRKKVRQKRNATIHSIESAARVSPFLSLSLCLSLPLSYGRVDLPLCVCVCVRWAASLTSLPRVRSPTHTLSKAWPVLQAPLTGGPRTNERQPSTN